MWSIQVLNHVTCWDTTSSLKYFFYKKPTYCRSSYFPEGSCLASSFSSETLNLFSSSFSSRRGKLCVKFIACAAPQFYKVLILPGFFSTLKSLEECWFRGAFNSLWLPACATVNWCARYSNRLKYILNSMMWNFPSLLLEDCGQGSVRKFPDKSGELWFDWLC